MVEYKGLMCFCISLPLFLLTVVSGQTTTLSPGIIDDCSASGDVIIATISPNFDYLFSPGYENGVYPSNELCRWYITAPENYSVEAYFDNETYAIESNVYCRYDFVIFYDGNTTSDTMLNKFCGSTRPMPVYRSSGREMLITFTSDYTLEYAGFRIRIKAVDNTYPECKTDYTEYSVMYNREATYIFNNYTYINNLSSTNFGISNYPTNVEEFWLFTSYNTTHYKMVIDIITMNIERAYNCIYDKLVLYNGPCLKDGVLDTVCGYWAKRWDLEGPEYLLHFHSDGYITRSGFQLMYYAEEKSVIPPPTTTTTTFGPPVGAVVDAIKEMLGNYSNENLPARDLSAAITASMDFYLVGINGIDEVEQKMTSTGQFVVTWQDASLSWDPTKRQGVVQVLLPQNDVWKPDIALMNGFTSITAMGAKFMFINVDYNGSCIWRPYQIMESVCKVDMTHYPYDRQTCVLKFGSWSTDDSEVVTELGSLGLQIHPKFQDNAEWRLITTETRQEDNNNHKVVEFFLTLERNPRYVTFYMTVPIIVLAYMNVFTFVIPSESGEKTGFSITIFLSFVVLLIINNDSLPENSDSISLYAAFVLTMTLLSAVALMVSVLQIRALTFTEKKYPITNRIKKLMKHVKRIQFILTCRKTDQIISTGELDSESNVPTDSRFVDGAGESSSLVKKVSFKNENAEGTEDDRFSFPFRHDPIKTVTKDNTENTLFESNTLIRSATTLSQGENSSRDNGYEGRISFSKTVKFADEREKREQYKSLEENPIENTTFVDDTSRNQSTTIMTGSKITADPTVKATSAELNQFLATTDYQSAVTYDDTGQSKEMHVPSSSIDASILSTTDMHTTGVTLIAVSPKTESVEQDLVCENHNETLMILSEKNSERNQSVSCQDLQPDDSKVLTDLGDANVLAAQNGKSLLILNEAQRSSLGGGLSECLESNIMIGVGNQSSLLKDDITQMQSTSATDFKMNRPQSTAENRPLSVSKHLSAMGSRLVLTDHGRAVSVNTDRPKSRISERANSVVGQRTLSFVTQRPASSLDSTALLFGAEEFDKTSTGDDEEVQSTKSEDSVRGDDTSSESSEASCQSDAEDDNLSWSDLVSCTDAIFFVIYILITTIMTLSMFMTMIKAY